MSRPKFVTQEHLDYLDDLRESGQTNMYGAGPYLMRDFDIERELSHKILDYWMKSFGKANR